MSLVIWTAIFALCLCASLLMWACLTVASKADDDMEIEPVENPEPPPARLYVLADFVETKKGERP